MKLQGSSLYGKIRAFASKSGRLIVDIVFWIIIVAMIYILLRIFVFSTFTIPSNSMYPTLLPGDRVLVEKLSTGARIFDIFKAADGERVDISRTPHWHDGFGRGDVLVFNFPYSGRWDSIAMNYRRYYVKRCVGRPGDTVSIADFKYVVNGREEADSSGWSRRLIAFYPEDSIARAEEHGYTALDLDSVDNWTIRDFGPLIVPAKGMSLNIDKSNCLRYKQIIEWETGSDISMADDIVLLDGNPIGDYEFNENYYFVAGDFRLNSQDSRYWGLLPEQFIVGRAVLIYWSENDDRIKFHRILSKIN